MKFIYPAIFKKNEEGLYEARFPDLECCRAVGESLDEAIERANEAAYDWIAVELDEEEPNLPPISEIPDLELEEGEIARNILVNIRMFEGYDE